MLFSSVDNGDSVRPGKLENMSFHFFKQILRAFIDLESFNDFTKLESQKNL
jgi:hypothetical protein